MVLVKDGVSESGTICDGGKEKEGRTKHYFKVGFMYDCFILFVCLLA